MNKKKIISRILAAFMTISLWDCPAAFASEHQTGAHDFGDPFAPYVNSKLVMQSVISGPTALSHTSKNVQGSNSVTTDITETSARFYSRDNGDGSLPVGSLTSREYGNVQNIMFAYMYEPAKSGTYPAILFLHGGGGTADTMKDRAKDFAAKGYVTMAIDIPALTGTVGNVTIDGVEAPRSLGAYIGNDSNRFNITEADGGAKNSNLVDAEIGVLQAFNYLYDNTKTDKNKVGIMGSSWGGYSATFVSGILGDKVAAVYSQYGSGFYGPTPDGSDYGSFWTVNGYFPTDEFAREEWYRYLDPSSHLDSIKANYYMDSAAKDTFFWPTSVMATLNKAEATAASANHVWSYNSSHESISGSDSLYPFMDYYLKDRGTAPSKTKITKTEVLEDGSNKVHISVNADAASEWVKLAYSANNASYQTRNWNTLSTLRDGDEYIATIPQEVVANGVDYYAITKDSDKLMYSSSMMKTGFTQKVSVTTAPTFTLNGEKTNVIGKGELKAKISVVNNDDMFESNALSILALYKNNVLKGISMSDTSTLAAGESADLTASINIDDEDIAGYSAKLMIWDSLKSLKTYSRVYNITDIDLPPTPPENLVVCGSTINGIELSWDSAYDNVAVMGYNIYKKSDGGTFEKIASLASSSLSYTDTMIEVNQSYTYAVTAIDTGNQESDFATAAAESIKGAKVLLNEFDQLAGTTINGEKMQAHISKNLDNGSSVELEANHEPFQDKGALDRCLKIVNGTTAGTGRYIDINVDNDYIDSRLDSKVAVMVTFDDINFDSIKMQYNSAENAYKGATVYKKLNEQRWLTKTYIIEDAKFSDAQSGGYDLRLNFDSGTTNYISKIQIVNLSDSFKMISSTEDTISLTWKPVDNAQSYNIIRDGVLIGTIPSSERVFTDTGLVIDSDYQYSLVASTATGDITVDTIIASTLKKSIANVNFNDSLELNMKATATGFTEEVIDDLKAFTTSSSTNTIKLAVDNTVVSGSGHRLVTFKYNDCGNVIPLRVSMVNSSIDRAHYFYTNGTNKWELATVLIPDATFNNNTEDIQIRSTANLKYGITCINLADCNSYETGGYYVNNIVSGISVADDMLCSTMATFKTGDKTQAEITKVDSVSAIKLNSTDIIGENKRAEVSIVPDYRFLGQWYPSAVLPGADGYDERPAMIRPVIVRVTYYSNNTAGAIYVKGAKLLDGAISNPDNDGVISLAGTNGWQTKEFAINDYYVCGSSTALNSPIKLIASGVPQNENIIIGKVEIINDEPGFTVSYDRDNAHVLIDWSVDNAVSYKIYRNNALVGSAETMPYTDNDIKTGAEYSYYAKAYDADGLLIKKTAKSVKVAISGTKIASVNFNDLSAQAGMSATFDSGIEAALIDETAAMKTTLSGASFKFAVDKQAAPGTRDRLLTIKYHDGGISGTPVRVSMVNNSINGAHYFYTRGTNRFETATILIPDATFTSNPTDIQIRLIKDGGSIAISQVELYDGCEHIGQSDDIGARSATGIASGLTMYNGLFNSSLATWITDSQTTIEPVTIDGVDAFRLVSSLDNKRAEIRIVPDYRFLGQRTGNVKYPAETTSYPNGEIRPITLRVTYLKSTAGILYISAPCLNEAQTGLDWTGNDATIALSAGDSQWVSEELTIDDYYMNGGADKFNSYIKFVTNACTEGAVIKSIEILNQ